MKFFFTLYFEMVRVKSGKRKYSSSSSYVFPSPQRTPKTPQMVMNDWRSGRYSNPFGPSMVQAATNTGRRYRRAMSSKASQVMQRLIKKSPGGIFLKRGGVMVQRRRFGASTSKSSGFFAKGTPRRQVLDAFSKRGVVLAYESGGQLTTNAIEAAQSMAIGHSLFTYDNLYEVISSGILKFFAEQMDMQIRNFEDKIQFGGANLNLPVGLFTIEWTPSIIGSPNTNQITVTDTTSWTDVQIWLSAFLQSLSASGNNKSARLLTLEWKYDRTPDGEGGFYYAAVKSWDLTKARIKLYGKSALKIQNRTINTAGNLEADDVDNVPIYGKSYFGSGNYVGYFDPSTSNQTWSPMLYITNGTPVLDKLAGVMYAKFIGNHPLTEPPVKSTLRNVKSVGKAHLDPGQVKTDVLTIQKSFNINTLINLLFHHTGENTQDFLHNIGLYKVFLFEKMIQAVATNNVNGIHIAYEVDLKIASIFSAPKTFSTNYIVTHLPL